eukprot:TRINITY_DN16586_c0_g1_i1.p1 TRINITY_DN16586_c0_g1~~TRINITY_DN16586_c0_g1_i1.p1  ORF type:complete len:687 (-),score=202.87 TRINITY_DN16586_c0_g1_i1:44-2104(-)
MNPSWAQRPRKRMKLSGNEEDWLEEDDEDSPSMEEEKDSRGGERAEKEETKEGVTKGEEEIDPLDAFMAGLEHTISTQKESGLSSTFDARGAEVIEAEENFVPSTHSMKGKGKDFSLGGDEDSDEEVYEAERNAEKSMGVVDEEEMLRSMKEVKTLPPLDHSKIKYDEFLKDIYHERSEVGKFSREDVLARRRSLDVQVEAVGSAKDVVFLAPLLAFEEMIPSIDPKLIHRAKKRGWNEPTPVQAQCVPFLLRGRDLIGLGKTGSGKTAAYVWPLISHVCVQRRDPDGAPRGVVVAPTRELAQQVFSEVKMFARDVGLRVVLFYGGTSQYEESRAMKDGCDIVVSTPGRLIDHLSKKSLNPKGCTFLVLDEADKMFEMGFEPQVRSIMGQFRPDRQTVMFSATFGARVENLAKDSLKDPVKILVGRKNTANADIKQIVRIVRSDHDKMMVLVEVLEDFVSRGRVLIFSNSKDGCDYLASQLKKAGYQAASIHGEWSQKERDSTIRKLRKGELDILVATDIASRGLDIPAVRTVVNYDLPKDIRAHIHRIGRCGRAGATDGIACTLVPEKAANFARELADNISRAGQIPPPELRAIAGRAGGSSRYGSSGGRGRGNTMGSMGVGASASSFPSKTPLPNPRAQGSFKLSSSSFSSGGRGMGFVRSSAPQSQGPKKIVISYAAPPRSKK